MKLSQKELEIIRLERMTSYKKRIEKHLDSIQPHFAVSSFIDDLKSIVQSIKEVENELDENYPKWDDIPF